MKITGIDRAKSTNELGEAKRYLVVEGMNNINAPSYFKALHAENQSQFKRDAILSGSYIIVTCRLDELQDQINILNPICAKVTEKVQQHIEDAKRRAAEERQIQEAALKTADDAYNALKFD